jgi:hypothetical protein
MLQGKHGKSCHASGARKISACGSGYFSRIERAMTSTIVFFENIASNAHILSRNFGPQRMVALDE